MANFKGFFFGLLILTVGSLLGSYFWLSHEFVKVRSISSEESDKASFRTNIKMGASLDDVCTSIRNSIKETNCFIFKLSIKVFGDFRKFQAGLYQFQNSFSYKQLNDSAIKGLVFHDLQLNLIVPEGFTLKQIAERLEQLGIGSASSSLKLAKDPNFIKKMGLPSKARTLEGFLYPSSYQFFDQKPSAQAVFEKMIKHFYNKLPPNYSEKLKKLGIDLHDAVVMASLIQLETSIAEEKPMVSEVIWNRLKAGSPLGIDAALIYGIPNYDGDIRWRDLRNAKNPYNLRIHKGLPPTPIANPDIDALESVVNPTSLGNFYYVLKPDGSKTHHFSKTAREHQKHVEKLINANR